MNSASGGTDNGEKSGYAKDWRSRVWCRMCVDSAECAVMSLHISS